MHPSRYRWVIVGVLWLGHVINYLNFSSLGVLAPYIKEDLKLSSAEIGIFVSAVSVGACISILPAGLMTDMIGVRLIFSFSLGITGLLWVFFSSVLSYAGIILLLMAYGVTFAAVSPPASKSIADWFPPVGRATAMGLKQIGVNFGGILAGVLLPFLAVHLSWRRGLLLVGIAEMACAVLIYCLLKESPARARRPSVSFDWKAVIPLLRDRNILILGGVTFCFFACQYTFSAYLSLYLAGEKHYPLARAGLFYALAFFVGAGARILWSLVSDYFLGGRRKGVLMMLAWITLFSLLFLSLGSFSPLFAGLLPLAVLAFGASGIGYNALLLTLLAESGREGSVAMATGIGFFFGYGGSLFCPPLFGYIADRTGTYGYGWLFLAFCAALILVMMKFFRELAVGKRN